MEKINVFKDVLFLNIGWEKSKLNHHSTFSQVLIVMANMGNLSLRNKEMLFDITETGLLL